MTTDRALDLSGLRWIRRELEENLRQTRLVLEDFVSGQTDGLTSAVQSLHQVRGALTLAQIHGAAMLADELERLARALDAGAVGNREEAAEVLMLGIVQLPAYLDRIETGEPDIPLILLPVMNELRAAREAPLVSEASLFAPRLDAQLRTEPVTPGSGNPRLPETVARLRPDYHRALLGWFRESDVRGGLKGLRSVIDRVSSAAGTARLRRLLDAAEALLVALLEESVPSTAAVKQLFGRLDRVFKRLIDQGEEAVAEDFPVDLLKNFLYYIARSDSTDPVVQAVRRAADLANSFPELADGDLRDGLQAGPGRELFESVARALEEDLHLIKEQLDLYMRGERGDLERYGALAEPIRRMADTLGMIGQGELRAQLVPHADRIRACVEAGTPPEEADLERLAWDLLSVESALPTLSERLPVTEETPEAVPEGEYRQHVRAALEQAFVELARVKDALGVWVESGRDELLQPLPEQLHALGGVFRVLDQVRVAELLEALGGYIEHRAEGFVPDATDGEHLGDLVTGIEVHLESLLDPTPDRRQAMALAEAAATALGLAVASSPEVEVSDDAEADREAAASATESGPAAETPESGDDAGVGSEEVSGLDAAAPPMVSIASPEATGAPSEGTEPESTEETVEAESALAGEASEPVGDAAASGAGAGAEPAADAGAAVDGESHIDSEILEIFVEEAREELAALQEQVPRWRQDREDREALTRVRRSFHTLKGSGRLVGALEIGEFAWAIENLLNRVIDGTVEADEAVFSVVDDALDVLPGLIEARASGTSADVDPQPLQQRADALARGEAPPAAQAPTVEAATGAGEDTADDEAAAETLAESASAAGIDVEVVPDAPAEAETGAEAEIEPEIASEAGPDSASATDEEAAPSPEESDDFGLDSIELDGLSESMEFESASLSLEADEDTQPLLLEFEGESDAEDQAATAEAADDGARPTEEVESILTPAAQERPSIELDSTLHEIFSREAAQHLAVIGAFLDRCRGVASGCVYDEALRRALHTLRGSARMAQVEPVAELAGALERWCNLQHELGQRTDQAGIDLLERGHHVLDALLSVINVPGGSLPSWRELVEEIETRNEALDRQLSGGEDNPESERGADEAFDEELAGIFVEEARELLETLEQSFGEWRSRPDDLLPVAQMQRGLHTIKGGARLAGIASVGDLSHAMESLFESVVEQRIPGGPDVIGLARQALDVVSSQIETLEQGGVPEAHDALVERLHAVARGERPPESTSATGGAGVPAEEGGAESLTRDSSELLEDTEFETLEATSASHLDRSTLLSDSQLLTDSELLAESDLTGTTSALVPGDGDAISNLHVDSRIIQFPARGRAADAESEEEPPRRPPPPPEDDEPRKASRERIRVGADLLDQMVNNAGEVNIYGARLEQQNKTLGTNLEELAQTIYRLRRQLRQLENETEAQILSRHEREHDGDLPEGFDPLEMDRYSTIQQLSRALAETTEDLDSISGALQELVRDTDTLLQQQGRVINDLQDGLLRTRMVPVASRASRLQRVVRQTAATLGKQAELTLEGGAGEMDRAILERMMGPLEHLLRNAVAHGIEAPAEREQKGKPALGRVLLRVDRDGSDVVLEVSDDGRGLDREAIRRKAVERGLLDPDARIDGEDLDAFILEAGFSTSAEVTQVAGRGVGMDVVVNEIKQLGGSLEIHSEPGAGTRFTIRLPFTLAISEALLVGVDEEVYAVPHGSLEGIARIPRSELEACYRGERESFSYGGREYAVRYLGRLLGTAAPHLPEGERWLPLLLVRSGDHRLAIQVDHLLGNRQIVVKSLGVQLASIRWFSGGTILADGSIALILDVGALVRMDSVQHAETEVREEAAPVEAPGGVKVMVVDDSITVRKVTSRLLERHNMQVITARDGVDAIALLQTERPDVMLLDIEMPRMDGFELARHMRSTEELKDIPIIMITSRTGDKHRRHAMELGVRRYLGKPYQEAELLENIYTVLAEVTT